VGWFEVEGGHFIRLMKNGSVDYNIVLRSLLVNRVGGRIKYMARLLEISELDAFAKTRSIPESAISDEILTEVKKLREKEQLEVWIQELIGSHDKTPHGPTILAPPECVDYSQQFQNVMAFFHNLFLSVYVRSILE